MNNFFSLKGNINKYPKKLYIPVKRTATKGKLRYRVLFLNIRKALPLYVLSTKLLKRENAKNVRGGYSKYTFHTLAFVWK